MSFMTSVVAVGARRGATAPSVFNDVLLIGRGINPGKALPSKSTSTRSSIARSNATATASACSGTTLASDNHNAGITCTMATTNFGTKLTYGDGRDRRWRSVQQHQNQHRREFHSTPVVHKKKPKRTKKNSRKESIVIHRPIYKEEFGEIEGRYPEDAEYPTNEELDEMYANTPYKLIDEYAAKYIPGSGMRKRPPRIGYTMEVFDELLTPEERLAMGKPPITWTTRHKRCGALGIKLGMIPIWDEWGVRHPCTVLYLDSNVVLTVKTKEKHGYDAVVLGGGEYKKKNVTMPLMGIYEQYGVDEHPPYITKEFRITPLDGVTVAPEPGSRIHARHFLAGQAVDIAGTSKGKGFAGGMKRWGFAGMPATHGTSRSHRSIGSTGQCQDPGKVFKGKKMPGRMGADRVTVQNLRVIKIDRGRDLIYVRGAVPGPKGKFVEIRDAVKRPYFGTDKVEGGEESIIPPLPTYEYDGEVDGSGIPGYELIKPLEQSDPDLPLDEAA